MNLISIAKKLAKGDLYYALGRFYCVRKCYSAYRKCTSYRKKIISCNRTTLFPTVSTENAILNIKKEAVAFGFNLPAELVEQISQFAKTEACTRSGDRRQFFFSDVKMGKLNDNNSVVLGFVDNPQRLPAIHAITNDQKLLSVCSGYLGYKPTHIETRLYWSFATHEPDEVRQKKWQTTRYHFDVDGFNFLYANFYITPVTRYSGAHVMIQGSHCRKPLRMLFHSANQTDEAIFNYYLQKDEIVIEGPSGLGFIQDSSCYHKALPPEKDHRLMLQLRIK